VKLHFGITSKNMEPKSIKYLQEKYYILLIEFTNIQL